MYEHILKLDVNTNKISLRKSYRRCDSVCRQIECKYFACTSI